MDSQEVAGSEEEMLKREERGAERAATEGAIRTGITIKL